jgi:hypothetical protein
MPYPNPQGQPPMGPHPIVNQPNQIMGPGALVPSYVGTAAVGDYFYANPMMAPYGEVGVHNPYRAMMRRKMMMRRARMEAMMMAEAGERMRLLEMAEMGMPGMGMGMRGMGMGGMGMGMPGMGMGMGYGDMGMGYGMMRGGFMDDSYLMYGGGRVGPCGYPHRRGIPCPDCHDGYMV